MKASGAKNQRPAAGLRLIIVLQRYGQKDVGQKDGGYFSAQHFSAHNVRAFKTSYRQWHTRGSLSLAAVLKRNRINTERPENAVLHISAA